jgi:hypothetical protein
MLGSFLPPHYEFSKEEIKKIIPFIITLKKKYVLNKFNQKGKRLAY